MSIAARLLPLSRLPLQRLAPVMIPLLADNLVRTADIQGRLTQPGGFSPGVAVRVRGRRLFESARYLVR